MAEYSVLIIGAGTKGASGPVSHAEAFSRAGFKILGFVDTSFHKAEAAAQKWGGQAFSDIDEAFDKIPTHRANVTVVAVPDGQHYEVITKASMRSCGLIFAEKPFTRSASQAKEILENFGKFPIAVNYTRRFAATFMHLQTAIEKKYLGNFLGGSGFYGKGLYHNGSHMLDLLLMLFGDVQAIQSFDKINDGNPEDPSVSALLECSGKPFYLGVLPRTAINAFEATLYFERAAFRITDCGRKIECFPSDTRYDFPTEYVYGPGEAFFSSLSEPMPIAVQNILWHLENGTALLSPAENAIKVLELCEALS